MRSAIVARVCVRNPMEVADDLGHRFWRLLPHGRQIRELTSSVNTGRQERVTAWSVADRVRSVPPTLRILIEWRLLRYDSFFRKAGAEPNSGSI